MSETPEAIYKRPEDYDLEHVGDTDDVEFLTALVSRFRPNQVLEFACGNGRITLPLAQAGATGGFGVTGVEIVPEMLEAARRRLLQLGADLQERLSLSAGDMRTWTDQTPYDVVLTACSSMCHLLTIEDQIGAWQCAYRNLAPGGRFIVDISMADLGIYSDSSRTPPRELVEIDLDTFDEATQTRLIRYKTTRYLADEQRARIRFLYDKYIGSEPPQRTISDFESHVYYPRELELLFRLTGFEIEAVYGDYRGRPLGPSSPQMIYVGRRPL